MRGITGIDRGGPAGQHRGASMPRGLQALLLLLTLIAGMGVAAGQSDPLGPPKDKQALKHFKAGNALFHEHADYKGAIAEYKAGVLIEPAPAFHYNLGLCYRKLGDYEQAIFHYRRFLKIAELNGEDRATVEKLIRMMEDEMAKAASTAEPSETAPDVKLGEGSDDREPDPAVMRSTSATRPRWYQDGLGWGLSIGGALGIGVGGGFLLKANGLDSEAARESDQAERKRLQDQAGTWQTAGTVTVIAGGALVVAGIIKLVIRPHASAEVVVAPTEGGASVLAVGRF